MDEETKKRIKMRTVTGFMQYAAPEIAGNKGYYTELIDNWTIGAVLYFMISGDHPFPKDNPGLMIENITNAIYDLDIEKEPWCSIDKKLVKAVQGLLEIDPQDRLPIDELKKVFCK